MNVPYTCNLKMFAGAAAFLKNIREAVAAAIFQTITNFLGLGAIGNRLKITLWMPNFVLNPMAKTPYAYPVPLLRYAALFDWQRIIVVT